MPSLREIIKKLRKILFLGQVVCFTPVLKYCEFTFISTGKEMKRISRKETWKLPCQKNPQNPFWELLEAPMAKRRHSYLPLPPKTILLRYVKKILVSTLAHATCVLRSQWIFLLFIPLLLLFLLLFIPSFLLLLLHLPHIIRILNTRDTSFQLPNILIILLLHSSSFLSSHLVNW